MAQKVGRLSKKAGWQVILHDKLEHISLIQIPKKKHNENIAKIVVSKSNSNGIIYVKNLIRMH